MIAFLRAAKRMNDQQQKIDPEFLDILIQGISVLSNIATLASTWILLRNPQPGAPPPPPVGQPINNAQRDEIRQQLRQLRRSLEDTFENMEAILRLLEESRARDHRPPVSTQLVRFGTGTMLTVDELARANNFLAMLDGAAQQARMYARNAVLVSQGSGLPSQYQVAFDEQAFINQLNSILFESPDFGEAIAKLRSAQQQAEDYISNLERSLRGN